MRDNLTADECMRGLARHGPRLHLDLRPLASMLAEQLKNYEENPKAMREKIVRTIEQIEGERG